MDPIINSILDTDLYKFTQQQFVFDNYKNVNSVYSFHNRTYQKVTKEFENELKCQIENLKNIKITPEELNFISTFNFFKKDYINYLKTYNFNYKNINIGLDNNNNIKIEIYGTWLDNILLEVPLMSIISELYFKIIDLDWSIINQDKIAKNKAQILDSNKCKFIDFGTRRRRSFETQQIIINNMKNFKNFLGTSNLYFAMKNNIKCWGSLGHEIIQGISALESLNHPNKYAMEKWLQTFHGKLNIFLPDTFGLNSFLKDFDYEKAIQFEGVRHDSGDPYIFTDKMCEHYKKLKIDPKTKTIVFSDGLDVTTATKLHEYCQGKIKCMFGIGTNFTNDFYKVSEPTQKSKALNMVIKLKCVDSIPVVKLSDTPTKAIGDPQMVKIMKYIHFGETL